MELILYLNLNNGLNFRFSGVVLIFQSVGKFIYDIFDNSITDTLLILLRQILSISNRYPNLYVISLIII